MSLRDMAAQACGPRARIRDGQMRELTEVWDGKTIGICARNGVVRCFCNHDLTSMTVDQVEAHLRTHAGPSWP